jgi:hypothetical protein
MNQLDFFDATLEGKIYRMEKWISRLNRELLFLKKVYEMNEEIKVRRTIDPEQKPSPKVVQIEMFP